MGEKKTQVPDSQTVTDDQIVTQRTLARRSFLGSSGALLVGAWCLSYHFVERFTLG